MNEAPEAVAGAALEEAVGLAFRVLKIVMVVLVVLFASSGLFQIESNQVGFVRRLGVLDTTPLDPGPHWSWPVIDEIVRVDRRSERVVVETFDLGRTKAEAQAEALENKSPKRTGGLDPTRDGYLITGDANLLHVSLAARVRIADPPHRALVTLGEWKGEWKGDPNDDPKRALKRLLERSAVQAAAHRTVGTLLGAGKPDYLDDVRGLLQIACDDARLGLLVEGIDLERDLTPSPQVRAAFERVSEFAQKSDRLRSEAVSLATQTVSQANVAAEQRVSAARSEADRLVATALADKGRFQALLSEWRTQRPALQERLLTETLVRAAPNLDEVFVITEGELRIHLEREVGKIEQEQGTEALKGK